jgi:hypothetical protein
MEKQLDTLRKVWAMAPYIVLYGAAFGIVGLFNLLSARYVTNVFDDAAFWNRFLSQTIANILVFSATVMLYLERRHQENPDYSQFFNLVERSAKNDLHTDFGEWVIAENKKEKMRTHKNNVLRQITKDEKKARIEDIEIWYSKDRHEEKQNNKYCQDRQRLMESIQDYRLEPIIMAIKVDYDRIDKNFVEKGSTSKNEKVREQKDSAQRKVVENLHRVFYMVGGAAFFNAFVYDINLMNPVFWLQFTQAIFFLAWMFVNGKAYGIGYIERILMVDLNTRFNIIRDYMTWKIRRQVAPQPQIEPVKQEV